MTTLTHHKKAVRAVKMHPKEFSFVSAAADNMKKWQVRHKAACRICVCQPLGGLKQKSWVYRRLGGVKLHANSAYCCTAAVRFQQIAYNCTLCS